jgi:HAD-superfamily hydrolase, subfamily IIB
MKIVFADIDGTFIKDREIPPENIEAVKFLEKSGNRFVFVSGRGEGQIEDILQQGGFDCDYIYGNGAGYRFLGEEPILQHYIPASEYDYWENLFVENKAFYTIHTTEGILMQPLEDISHHFDYLKDVYAEIYGIEMAQYLENKKNDYYGKKAIFAKNPFDYLREHLDVKLIKFELLNGEEDIRSNISRLASDIGYLAFSSVRINLEIVPALSNKGEAIKNYLTNFENVEKTYGFGDALNDLEMFEVVDVAVAVENAMEEVKEICDVILNEEMGTYILREVF